MLIHFTSEYDKNTYNILLLNSNKFEFSFFSWSEKLDWKLKGIILQQQTHFNFVMEIFLLKNLKDTFILASRLFISSVYSREWI